MWWTFETAYDYFDPTGKRDSLSIDGFLLTDDIDGFAVQMFGADKDGRPGIWAFGYEYGMRFPDDLPEDMLQAPSQQLLSLLAFLNSPYIPKRHERPTRAERREQQRESEPTDEQVTFIDLRTTPTTTTTESDGTTTEVGWKHRWIVRGHNRAQWYPSEQAHHLIYIAPYMKGPEDAPLLEHVYRVKR